MAKRNWFEGIENRVPATKFEFNLPAFKNGMNLAKTLLTEPFDLENVNVHITPFDDFMADLEAIDYDLWHQRRVIYSQNFAERLKGVFSKRKSDREKKTPPTVEKRPKLVLELPEPRQEQQDDDMPFGLTQKEIDHYREIVDTIYDAARDYGLPVHQGNLDEAVELVNKYSLEWVMEAIKRTGDGKEQTWRYLKGILRKWEAKGEIDKPGDRNKPDEPDPHALDQWGGTL